MSYLSLHARIYGMELGAEMRMELGAHGMRINFAPQTLVPREHAMAIPGDLWLSKLTQESGRLGVSPHM